MKNKKVPGWDKVTIEHLKHSGELIMHTVTWLMNSMVKLEIIPKFYKKGLIVPIPKANKDHTIKDNNRGITLLSVLYKLIERIIIKREKQ